MSSPSTARALPALEASPLEQAAELVEDFVLERGLEALDRLHAAPTPLQGPEALAEAAAMARSLTEQSRLVDQEIARYLKLGQQD